MNMGQTDSYESEHLIFRAMTREDTDLVLKWRNSDAVRMHFLYREDITREQYLKRYDNEVRSGKIIQFIIIDKESDKPIGSVYLRDIDPVRKRAEYGIFIGEDSARGRGLGSETARFMVSYFFDKMKYDKLYLRVLADNVAAINSYKSAGFCETDDEEILKLTGAGDGVTVMAVLKGDKDNS